MAMGLACQGKVVDGSDLVEVDLQTRFLCSKYTFTYYTLTQASEAR